MSTSLIGGVVGAVVGFVAGGPTGAQIGWFIGSSIGATFEPNEQVQGQLLTDLRITGTDYGQPIPYVEGHPRIAGQIWWASDRRAIATVTESGGKGGGGGVETTTYTYDVDLLIGLCDNEILSVVRIWDNGKLIWTAHVDSTPESRAASQQTDAWDRMTVYTGTATQLPDPIYEAAVGTANAPAYRHRAYVFIESMHLGGSGQLRNLTFEVMTKGSTGEEDLGVIYLCNFNGSEGSTTFVDETGIADTNQAGGQAHIDADVTFRGGQAVYFDGNSDYVSVESTTDDYLFWTANQPFTVEVAFVSDGEQLGFDQPNIFTLYRFGFANTLNLYIYWDGGSGTIRGGWRNAAGSFEEIGIVFDLEAAADELHDVCLAFDGTTMRLALDGDVGASAVTTTFTTTQQQAFYLGAHPGVLTNQAFKGWIVDVRITDRDRYLGDYVPADTKFELEVAGVMTPEDEDIDDVVSRRCVLAGLTAGQFDVTGLSSITKQLRSHAVSQIAPSRQQIDLYSAAFYFEATVSDKIYFRPRGGASAATIPYLDLGAAPGQATDRQNDEPFALKFTSEIETPAQRVVSYLNVDDDYQTGTEESDRLESALVESVSSVTMPLGMTADEAKGIANTMLWDQVASNGSAIIKVLGHYAKLEPTDVITAVDADGDSHRLRIVRRTDTWPLLEFEVVKDDASVLQDQGITSLDYTPSIIVEAAVDTVMELMDIPILRDGDDDPGFYVATKGSGTPYPGSKVLQSTDDVEYEAVATITESAIIGTCTTTLGDWSGPPVFDETNTVTVDVGSATLSSSTRNALIANGSVNAMLIGSEVIQFRTATLVSAGVYTLSGLLRGGRGTEWAMTGHSASERCIRLRTAGLRRISMQTNELGDEKYYKGVTLGRRISTATAETFTNNGIGLKPFSPTSLRAFQDVGTGDITITCFLRSRLATRGLSTTSQHIPLGEDSAAAELDIADAGDPATILRTLSGVITGGNSVGRTATFTYTAAQQATDSTTHGSIYYRAYQISETVNRGYALEKAA